MGRSFLENKQIFALSNSGDTAQRYELLIKFISTDINYLEVKYDKIDVLIEKCFNLNLFTMMVVLLLNIP
jgi:hypothetical protein